MRIWHGDTSKALPAIKRSGRIVGYWSRDSAFDAARYALLFLEGKSQSKYGYPVVFEAEVPASIIIRHDIPFHVMGFRIKGGYVIKDKMLVEGHGSGTEQTAVLPVRYVKCVWHWKHKTNMEMIVFNEGDFTTKDWSRRKL